MLGTLGASSLISCILGNTGHLALYQEQISGMDPSVSGFGGWGDPGGRSDPAGCISVTVFLVWDRFQACGLLWGSEVDLLASSDPVETRPLVSLSLP